MVVRPCSCPAGEHALPASADIPGVLVAAIEAIAVA